ncbi:MAG: histidine kinase, partial [Sulfurovum sp.]
LFQLIFIRFMADQIYLKKQEIVLPNFLGVLALSTVINGSIGALLWLLFFRALDFSYSLLMFVNFILLCNVWLVVIFIAGMRRYKTILKVFFIAYVFIVVLSLLLSSFAIKGFLFSFLVGHLVLFFSLFVMILQEFDAKTLVRFDFFQQKNIFLILIPIGVFFNMGVWVDKWVFWFAPSTSDSVNGVLRSSVMYDMPIFLAYISIIPGMASFLLRIETDFVDKYKSYYSAVNGSSTLSEIKVKRSEMINSIYNAYLEILKVQGVTLILFILFAKQIFKWLDLSPLYLNIFYLDLLSTAVQVLYLATLNLLFYFNLLKQALWLTLGLFVLNAVFSMITVYLGPAFYGYGFALAIVISTLLGMRLLSDKIDHLEYLTFMLQR